jgi:hypothetical protein
MQTQPAFSKSTVTCWRFRLDGIEVAFADHLLSEELQTVISEIG